MAVEHFSGGVQSSGDAGNTDDPLNLGATTGSTYFTTESLGDSGGIVYKTTTSFSSLTATARGTFNNGSAFRARWSKTKPGTGNMTTHGTQIFDVGSVSNFVFGNGTIEDVPANAYIWFYPSADRTLSNRSLVLTVCAWHLRKTSLYRRLHRPVH